MFASLRACAVFLLVLAVPAAGQSLSAEPFLAGQGLATPVAMEAPPGDQERLFIAELHTGRVRVAVDGQLLAAPFLDLSSDVSIGGERGLFDLAFHPLFPADDRVYVSYTNATGASVVAEYRPKSSNPNEADLSTRRVVFGPLPQPADSHNGGCIEFGLDGYLYIGLGDGAFTVVGDEANHAQRLDSYFGKLLRLDIDAPPPHVPATNPFLTTPGALPLIWSYGLRNPWRFSFDRATGDLWLSDLGQFEREEINFQRAGAAGGRNYGWRCFEGTKCTGYSPCPCPLPGVTPPFHEYPHAIGSTFLGCAVTGGYVYRGTDMPLFEGRYFFADYCSNKLWSVRRHLDGSKDVLDHSADLAGLGLGGIASFAQDSRGELYLLDTFKDRIFRLDQNPIVSPGWTLPYGCGFNAPTALHLDGGSPELGKTLYLRLEAPAALTPGSVTILFVSTAPDTGFPCGLVLPAFGSTPFLPGELLVDMGSNLAQIHFGAPWKSNAEPTIFPVSIPSKLTLFQQNLFLQAITLDFVQANPVLSDAMVVHLGL